MQKNNFLIIYRILLISMVFFILSLVFTGCSSKLSQAQKEIESLKIEISELEDEASKKESELKDYEILTSNLNKLLSTVYYGSAVPVDEGRDKNFTAFSLFYNDGFYLITAGHCIEYDGIKYTDFKFKSNIRGQWIYPELLHYQTDYENNNDFAIFYSPSIRKGLIIDPDDKEPRYVLGNTERKLNFIKELSTASEGESGSPILSAGCKVVGIVIKDNSDFTPIEKVTEAIDKLSLEFKE